MAAIKCGQCGREAEPMIGFSDSGQPIKQCVQCSNQLSMALAPPSTAMMQASDDSGKRVVVPAMPMAASAPLATALPLLTNGHAAFAPLKRTTPPPRAPRAPSGDSAADILQARLDEAEAEIAHLEIEASRLVGLRAEVRHMRKQLAATLTRERVTKALAATPADPAPQADLFAKN